MCLPADHKFEAIVHKKKMDTLYGTNGLLSLVEVRTDLGCLIRKGIDY